MTVFGKTRLVPFGIDEWTMDLAEGPLSNDGLADPDFPCAVIDAETHKTLRMNRQRFALPAALPRDMSVDGQYSALLDYLVGLCPTWDQLSRAFLAGYFDFLRGEIDANRSHIEARLRSFDGLFQPEHVLFSAPLPLPRAHLIRKDKGLGRADFAFRFSGGWLALLSAPSRMMPAQARQLRSNLENSGAEVREFSAARIASGPAFFRSLFPADELAFWEGETLPSGLALQGMHL